MDQHEELLNDRYLLLRPLGTGGMAAVYLAEDQRLNRRVAIKILHAQFAADPSFVARFEAEARMAAGLAHPNIVQVYDVGHDGERNYIVMEYVEGETLKDALIREGALQAPRALNIVSGVLAALQFAHAHNLIHRDVKSQNILLPDSGGVKVTDFGIAREFGSNATAQLTATGMVVGTVHYFSPEQAQGRPATPQSDIYSVGVILYEMLTGTLPFNADNPLAVAMQQINEVPQLPTRLNASVPAAAEAIVLKAMAKNPNERYSGAGAMKEAVDAVLSGAAQTTRMTPRLPSEGGVPLQAGGRPPQGPTIRRAPEDNASAPPNPSRRLWIAIGTLFALLVLMLGVFASTGGFRGVGGAASTATPLPTATRPVIVVHPTGTPTRTATATVSDTPAPTETKTAEATATAAPTTPAPTDTLAPTPSPSPGAGSPTPGTVSPNGQGSISLSPSTAKAGDTVTVTGSGWPNGATVSLSAAFGNSQQPLGQISVSNGGFSDTFTVPSGTTAGIYQISAQDNQGHNAGALLTVTQ